MEYLNPLFKLFFFISQTLVFIVLATLIYDLVLSASWTPFCFRCGIPLYKRRFRIKYLEDFNLLQTQLTASQTSLADHWQPQSKIEELLVKRAKQVHGKDEIQFKYLDATTIAYKQMQGKQSERLHGRISLHKKQAKSRLLVISTGFRPSCPSCL